MAGYILAKMAKRYLFPGLKLCRTWRNKINQPQTHDKMRTIPVASYQHIKTTQWMLPSGCSVWWLHSPICGDM